MAELIMLRYVQPGAHRPGLPEHDLDLADLAVLSEQQKRSIEEIAAEATGSGLYEPVFAAPEATGERPALSDMNKPQLMEVAADLGVSTSGTKSDILARVVEAEAAAEATAKVAAEAAAATGTPETPPAEEGTTEAPGTNPDDSSETDGA